MTPEHNHTSLSDLVAELQAALAALEAGTLDVQRIDALTERSRELHERLVVLRYKAFEQFVKADENDALQVSGEVDEAQTDLLSAIEEIETEQKPPVNPTPELFSFTPTPPAPTAELQPDSESEPGMDSMSDPAAQSAAEAEDTPELELESAPMDGVQDSPEEAPIHEKLANDKESLVQRLERAPLNQIKGSISLNQKFLLINELFDGDSERYEHVIGQLDQVEDRAAALALVDGLGEEGAESRDLLTELIERRYIE